MSHDRKNATKDAMNAIADGLEQILNGELNTERKNGFVLLVFPYGDESGICNYVSNGADRGDIIRMFKQQIKRFEELEGGGNEIS